MSKEEKMYEAISPGYIGKYRKEIGEQFLYSGKPGKWMKEVPKVKAEKVIAPKEVVEKPSKDGSKSKSKSKARSNDKEVI